MRRTRGLGLGRAVLHYNELAVPGLGGWWFGKPLLWCLLGIRVAQETGQPPIRVANAVEALACSGALHAQDPRVRGRQKLAQVPPKFVPFSTAGRPGFYVTQPMRQSMGEPLIRLGFVDAPSSRFNTFRLARPGERFLDVAFSSLKAKMVDRLRHWVRGGTPNLTSATMRSALSPLTPLPEKARRIALEQLVAPVPGFGESPHLRRAHVLRWLAAGPAAANWSHRPPMVPPDHWDDLRRGAALFGARDAALAVLDSIEDRLRAGGVLRLPWPEATRHAAEALDTLRARATAYTAEAGASLGRPFCQACRGSDGAAVVRHLVALDGRGLRPAGEDVAAGPAFRPDAGPAYVPSPDDGGTDPTERLVLPRGISHRVRNAFTLRLDLHGELDAWLGGD